MIHNWWTNDEKLILRGEKNRAKYNPYPKVSFTQTQTSRSVDALFKFNSTRWQCILNLQKMPSSMPDMFYFVTDMMFYFISWYRDLLTVLLLSEFSDFESLQSMLEYADSFLEINTFFVNFHIIIKYHFVYVKTSGADNVI